MKNGPTILTIQIWKIAEPTGKLNRQILTEANE